MNQDQIVERFYELGFPLIPIQKRKKLPVGKDWNEKPLLSQKKIRQWIHDGGNIGIRLKDSGYLGIDVDTKNPNQDGATSRFNLIKTFPTLKGASWIETPSGGWHCYVKLPDECKDQYLATLHKSYPGIEFRSNGQMLLPFSSVKYKYNDKTITGVYRFTDLSFNAPECPKGLVKLLLTDTKRNERTELENDIDDHISTEQYAELKAALKYLDANDYHEWVAVGAALRRSGERGYKLWAKWSKTASDEHIADDAELQRKWDRDIQSKRTGFKAVFAKAQRAGWKNPRKAIPDKKKKPKKLKHTDGSMFLQASQVPVEKMRWMWKNTFASNSTYLLAGEEGIGKSIALTSLVACVSTGKKWPNGSKCHRGKVLLFAAEDDLSSVTVPRLIAAGADLSNIYLLDPQTSGFKFGDEEKLEELEEFLVEHKDVRLVVFDPIADYVTTKNESYDEVSASLITLNAMCQRHDVSIWMLRHTNKGQSNTSRGKIMGTVAWRSKPRGSFIMNRRPMLEHEDVDDVADKLVFSIDKANYLKDAQRKSYEIQIVEDKKTKQPKAKWIGEFDMTANEIIRLNAQNDEGRNEVGRPADLREQAINWLLDNMELDREYRWDDLVDDARDEHRELTERTLRRAREMLRDRRTLENVRRDRSFFWKRVNVADFNDIEDDDEF